MNNWVLNDDEAKIMFYSNFLKKRNFMEINMKNVTKLFLKLIVSGVLVGYYLIFYQSFFAFG